MNPTERDRVLLLRAQVIMKRFSDLPAEMACVADQQLVKCAVFEALEIALAIGPQNVETKDREFHLWLGPHPTANQRPEESDAGCQ